MQNSRKGRASTLLYLALPVILSLLQHADAFHLNDVRIYDPLGARKTAIRRLSLQADSSSNDGNAPQPDDKNNDDDKNHSNSHGDFSSKRGERRHRYPHHATASDHEMYFTEQLNGNNETTSKSTSDTTTVSTADQVELLLQRVTQLEQIVATQTVQVKRLQQENKSLTSAVEMFSKVVELLREAGLQMGIDEMPNSKTESAAATNDAADTKPKVVHSSDDSEIFGKAPSSVTEAADAAGAAILAGVLAGKQRMLVDVRDAELTKDPETLVQFIELAILPVAAGLEGLKSKRNRLKIVFPTLSQLMEYRKLMALAAPEVVALSTLGFDPVEKQDNLVVIVAPSPDDEEGLEAMNELLAPTDPSRQPIQQPVVVLNHHMIPISGPAADFVVAYHLRLLSVSYVAGADSSPEFYDKITEIMANYSFCNATATEEEFRAREMARDVAIEAAVQHAQAGGVLQGCTRAMVIRAYPKPWHVFVDTSPDTDADFEIAATFMEEPSMEDLSRAINECLEGSEQENELVAQQMQQALEAGQLDRIADMMKDRGLGLFDDDADDDDAEDDDWDKFQADSV